MSEVPVEYVYETKSSTEADVEDEDVDVVGGVEEVTVSGYESEGFMLSVFFRKKMLSKRRVSKGIVDTSHLAQCEFSNHQQLPLTFLLDFLCWPFWIQ